MVYWQECNGSAKPMSVYGEFDARFQPRPSLGRLAVLGLCHFILAVWIANALVSTADMAVWRSAGVERSWIAYVPPWTTLEAEAERRIPPVARRQYEPLRPWITGGFVLLGALLLFLWPGRQTLGARLFSVRLAQCIAWFGVGFALRRGADLSPPVLAEMAIAAYVVIAGEWQVNAVLAQAIDIRRAVLRVAQWLLRTAPGTAVVAALAYFAAERIVLYLAILFAAFTLIANLIRKPPARYERIDAPEIRGATLTAAVLAALVLGGSFWLFGFLPLRAPRAPLFTLHSARIVTWDRLSLDLPGMFPAFEIHWSKPGERKKLRGVP